MNIDRNEVFTVDVGENPMGVGCLGVPDVSGSRTQSFNNMKALAGGAVLLREGRFIKPQDKGSAKRLLA